MFKGILPVKRIPSEDFTMITSFVEHDGKENIPGGAIVGSASKSAREGPLLRKTLGQTQDKKRKTDTKKARGVEEEQSQPKEDAGMHVAFDKLLDDLQIPSTLRPKLVGMDATVKAAMLKSSQTMTQNPPAQSVAPTTPISKSLRKAHSIESLTSPSAAKSYAETEQLERPPPPLVGSQVSAHHRPAVAPRKSSGHARGLSMDPASMFSRSQVHLPASGSTLDLDSGKQRKGRPSTAKGTVVKHISPTKFCSMLCGTSSTQLDVEDLKKLRLFLRNEAASWSEEFMALGGYSALLTRLNEVLELEWREEQHDDKVLHELLRCLKALATSAIGCFALRSSCPTPFVQLMSLLYSDKKPGDIGTRQLIADLLLILFEIYPSSSLPGSGAHRFREAWSSESDSASNVITLPSPHQNLFSLIRALLLTPAPPPTESLANPVSPHAFIESLHRPRIYKTYLQELSDLCRDYFWIFCHPNNTIWILSETDEAKVEKPRAPGGMTGGVEFEAMGYFTTHLRLINAIAKAAADLNLPKDHDHSAYRFHSDLFLSGLERIILISRKASTTYYPTLHLEIARCIAFAVKAEYELPYTVSRLIGLPPNGIAKSPSPSSGPTSSTVRTPTATPPTKRGGPHLPSPRKIEPLKF